jgi:hypothetical protein
MPSGHTSGLNRWGVAKRMMNGERRGIGECGRQAEYIAEKHRSCDSGVECIGASNNGENIVARHSRSSVHRRKEVNAVPNKMKLKLKFVVQIGCLSRGSFGILRGKISVGHLNDSSCMIVIRWKRRKIADAFLSRSSQHRLDRRRRKYVVTMSR